MRYDLNLQRSAVSNHGEQAIEFLHWFMILDVWFITELHEHINEGDQSVRVRRKIYSPKAQGRFLRGNPCTARIKQARI